MKVTHDEAVELALHLASGIGKPVEDDQLLWWAEAFEGQERETVHKVVRDLGRSLTWPPSTREVLDALRDARPAPPPALPEPVEPVPVEMVKELLGAYWGEGPQRTMRKLEAVKARRELTPEERHELGRARAAAMLSEPPRPPERTVLQAAAANLTCPGVRQPPVWKGKHMTCKLCGDDLDANCIPAPAAERKCVGIQLGSV